MSSVDTDSCVCWLLAVPTALDLSNSISRLWHCLCTLAATLGLFMNLRLKARRALGEVMVIFSIPAHTCTHVVSRLSQPSLYSLKIGATHSLFNLVDHVLR